MNFVGGNQSVSAIGAVEGRGKIVRKRDSETRSASKLIDLIDINKDEPSVWKSR
jgi:hypothetical protein